MRFLNGEYLILRTQPLSAYLLLESLTLTPHNHSLHEEKVETCTKVIMAKHHLVQFLGTKELKKLLFEGIKSHIGLHRHLGVNA